MTSRREVRGLIRRTTSAVDRAVRAKFAEQNRREVKAEIQRSDIPKIAETYISDAQPLMRNIEEFALAAAVQDWSDGVRGILTVAGRLFTLSEQLTGVRFASGLPGFL